MQVMNQEAEEIVSQLEQYSDSHPNVTTMWREYIRKKHEAYYSALAHCRHVIARLNDTDDLSVLQIYSVYAAMCTADTQRMT
jgi:hypothetical protein